MKKLVLVTTSASLISFFGLILNSTPTLGAALNLSGNHDPVFPQGKSRNVKWYDWSDWNNIQKPNNQPVTSVPEPVTTLGSVVAVGFGAFLRKKYSRQLNKQAVS
ncbi:MAG: PEP-CTERM sorting domain-containing protein [Gloeotrichia echinulata HAB0833]